MNTKTTQLKREANAPITHIFLSLDLLDGITANEESRSYLAIIHQNMERLQLLIQHYPGEVV